MSTEKLYWSDSYLKNFEATIKSVENKEKISEVILDRTAFYPTSGGQMHDTGQMDGKEVFHVVERDGEIVHMVRGEFKTGQKITGNLDWSRRFDFMQQHTGFHILAQAFLLIAKAETLSSHLGEQVSTIDLGIESISQQVLVEVEELANRIIYENKEVKAFICNPQKLKTLNLRKMPEAEENIRLIDIDGFDLDPCGGTHTKSTGEVGLVKVLSSEKIRGNLRYEFTAGNRAFTDYARKTEIISQLGSELTTGQEDFLESIQKIKAELRQSEKQCRAQSEKILAELSVKMIQDAPNAVDGIIAKVIDDMDWGQVRKLAFSVLNKSGASVIFAQKNPDVRLLAATKKTDINLRELVPEITGIINGKGGGKQDFIEIGGTNKDQVDTAIEVTKKFLK